MLTEVACSLNFFLIHSAHNQKSKFFNPCVVLHLEQDENSCKIKKNYFEVTFELIKETLSYIYIFQGTTAAI